MVLYLEGPVSGRKLFVIASSKYKVGNCIHGPHNHEFMKDRQGIYFMNKILKSEVNQCLIYYMQQILWNRNQ